MRSSSPRASASWRAGASPSPGGASGRIATRDCGIAWSGSTGYPEAFRPAGAAVTFSAVATSLRMTQPFEQLVARYQGVVCAVAYARSEEHTSELQSRPHLVCRLLL